MKDLLYKSLKTWRNNLNSIWNTRRDWLAYTWYTWKSKIFFFSITTILKNIMIQKILLHFWLLSIQERACSIHLYFFASEGSVTHRFFLCNLCRKHFYKLHASMSHDITFCKQSESWEKVLRNITLDCAKSGIFYGIFPPIRVTRTFCVSPWRNLLQK